MYVYVMDCSFTEWLGFLKSHNFYQSLKNLQKNPPKYLHTYVM
jgi:hypothetical protein